MKMIIDFCEKHKLFPRGAAILCGVSGGKDSMYLLENLRELAPGLDLKLACGHFNHKLRGKASDDDQRFVESYCKKLGIPCYVGEADVAAYGAENSQGIEEAARNLRYEFLEKTACQIDAHYIATAHTADDNFETLILNLVRGSGLKGLCGIPPVRGKIIRPMLETSTAEVLDYLQKNAIPHVEDETNLADDCTRNKIRHNIIPLLRELNQGLDENAARCISLISEDEAFLTSLALEFVEKNFQNGSLPAADFSALPAPISARVLRCLAPRELRAEHIRGVQKIADGQDPHASVSISGTRVFRDYEKLVFGERGGDEITKQGIVIDGITDIPQTGQQIVHKNLPKFTEIHNTFKIFSFNSDNICGNIFVAARSQGDEIRLSGRGCTKTLKKLFTEAHLNGEKRGLIPVIYDEKGPIAIYGFGIAERCAPKPGDKITRLEICDQPAGKPEKIK